MAVNLYPPTMYYSEVNVLNHVLLESRKIIGDSSVSVCNNENFDTFHSMLYYENLAKNCETQKNLPNLATRNNKSKCTAGVAVCGIGYDFLKFRKQTFKMQWCGKFYTLPQSNKVPKEGNDESPLEEGCTSSSPPHLLTQPFIQVLFRQIKQYTFVFNDK